MKKIIEFYKNLPKEFRIFIEFILPSAIITALIDYLTNLKINDLYIAGAVNIVLIFLREIKPRIEERKQK
jgi:TM2 domain-containing membrane protein YozV